MCCNCDGQTIPFLEQVNLFSETMNERFIENNDSGKCLIVFAMDGNNGSGKIHFVNAFCGDDFDLSYCIAAVMRIDKFKKLYNKALEVNRAIGNLGKKKPF